MLQQRVETLKPPLSGQSLRGHGNQVQPNQTVSRRFEGLARFLDFPRCFRLDLRCFGMVSASLATNFTVQVRVHRYKPICWCTITRAAPRCVEVPNLLAAVNAQRR